MAVAPHMSLAFASFTEAVAGGCGGFFSSFMLFPLDTLKTRAQAGNAKENRSALALAAKIWKEDGLRGFFRGSQWRGCQSFCEKFGYFYCYNLVRTLHRGYAGRDAGILMGLVLGYIAEWMHAPVTMPIDTAVVRVITQRRPLLSIVREMAQKPADCYKGASIFIVANLKVALQFAVYEQVKRVLVAANGLITTRNAFFAGALSRLVADTMLYPARRLKVTRQSYRAQLESGEITSEQAQEMDRKSNLELAVSIVRSGGVGSLFNGLGVELFRGVLSGAIMLSVKESLTLSVKIFVFTIGGYHEQARLLQVLRRS
jgi:hypothetical protein